MDALVRIPQDRDIPSYCMLAIRRHVLMYTTGMSGFVTLMELGITITGWLHETPRPFWSHLATTVAVAMVMITATLFMAWRMAERHFARILTRCHQVRLPRREGVDVDGIMVTLYMAIKRGHGEKAVRVFRGIMMDYSAGKEVSAEVRELMYLAIS